MKFGVVTFPGSNCDQDMIYVLRNVFQQKVEELWHQDKDLKNCDFIVLPGGFSYGDYLRSGAIARFAPIMTEVIDFAKKGGYVMGICNGFQILCESGLLGNATLLHNTNRQFICKNTFLKPETNSTILTKTLDLKKAYKIPIAHGEGCFYTNSDTLKKLNDNEQILFRYCNEKGIVEDSANPNGSLENIAGITNETKNIFGMMPHPERACDENLGNIDGKYIIESILKSI